MELLRNGRFTHQMATPKEINDTLKILREKVDKYGWGDYKIMPYNYPIKVSDFLAHHTDIERYTVDSRSLCISEINGFIKHCVEPWEKIELEPKVTIRFLMGEKAGTTTMIPESIASDYVDLGFCEYVKEN